LSQTLSENFQKPAVRKKPVIINPNSNWLNRLPLCPV